MAVGKGEGFRQTERTNAESSVDWYECEQCNSVFALSDKNEAYYCPHCGCKEIDDD